MLIIEKGIVPMKWPMARIIKTYPGEDGVTRVVDIKTAKGIYRRPVHKLAPLISMEMNLIRTSAKIIIWLFVRLKIHRS